MKILFFGDFHFDSVPTSGGLSVEYTTPVAEDPIMHMIEALRARYESEKISLIVFLGDYVKGKNTPDEKTAAFHRIKHFIQTIETECYSIFESTQNLKDRIILLDGNHDVSRDGDHHKHFEEAFGEYLTPFTQKQDKGVRRLGAPVFDFESLNLLFACISTTQNANARFTNKNLDLIQEYVEPLKRTSKKNYEKIMRILENERNVDIGSITTDAMSRMTRCSSKSYNTKIVASHHPLIQMQHATATHFETVNGPLFFDRARAKGYTYFISGHLHEFYCVDITSRGKSSTLPSATLISVPTFINPDYNSGQFVELNISGDAYYCQLLVYDNIRNMLEEKAVASNDSRAQIQTQTEHTLLDYEIQALIEDGKVIEGASTDRIQAVSYDCALGLSYKRYDHTLKSWPDEFITMEATHGSPAEIEIAPDERVLLYTHEIFHIPSNLMLRASPRASWNRRGIGVELSFIVEPGFEGPFCFPVVNKNKHPVTISAQEAIMSVTFTRLSDSVSRGWSERYPDSATKRKNKQDK